MVIGGNGFIGRHFINLMGKTYSNIEIISVDKNPRSIYIDNSEFVADLRQINMAIENPGALKGLMLTHLPDVVVFTAGTPAPWHGLNRPDLVGKDATSLVGLTETLEAFTEIKAGYFLYISSCAVYGEQSKKAIQENGKRNPSNNVGQLKVLSEDFINNYFEAYKPIYQKQSEATGNKYNPKYCILRPSEVYGMHHRKELLDPNYWPGYVSYYTDSLLEAVDAEKRLISYSQGEKPTKPNFTKKPIIHIHNPAITTDFVHVNYLAEVMKEACYKGLEGTYNVCSGESIPVHEAVNLITASTAKIKLLPGVNKQLIESVEHHLKDTKEYSNALISKPKVHKLVKYDKRKYSLSKFVKDYLPVRAVEITTHRDYVDAVIHGNVLDTTGLYSGGAYGKFKRKLADDSSN